MFWAAWVSEVWKRRKTSRRKTQEERAVEEGCAGLGQGDAREEGWIDDFGLLIFEWKKGESFALGHLRFICSPS